MLDRHLKLSWSENESTRLGDHYFWGTLLRFNRHLLNYLMLLLINVSSGIMRSQHLKPSNWRCQHFIFYLFSILLYSYFFPSSRKLLLLTFLLIRGIWSDRAVLTPPDPCPDPSHGNSVCGGGPWHHHTCQTCLVRWKLPGSYWADPGQDTFGEQQTHLQSRQVPNKQTHTLQVLFNKKTIKNFT